MTWAVAKREILVRSRTKVFRIITALLVVGAVAGVILSAVIGGGDGDNLPTSTIGMVDVDPTFRPQITAAAVDIATIDFTDFASVADAELALTDGAIDVAMIGGSSDGTELVWDQSVRFDNTAAIIRSAMQQDAFAANAADLGLGADELEQLFTPPSTSERFLGEVDDADGVRTFVALIGIVGTLFLIQVWGSLVAMSVIEEKASRVIEVLLSHITPRVLMTGKILGLGVLALSQAIVILGGLLVALLLIRDIEVPAGAWSSIPLILGCVITGFAFYSAAFGAAGSLVSRTEDAQQVMLPVMVPLFVGYMVATASVGNPDSTLIKVMSFIPFTMPVTLPLRAAAGALALWEVALAFAIIIVGTVLMMRFAARLYEFTLLRTGSRIGWREALWLARGASV